MQALADALNVTLKRDDCGDEALIGTRGNIHKGDDGYYLYVQAGCSRDLSTGIRRLAGVATVTQHGDADAVLLMRKVPKCSDTCEVIRDLIGLKQKKKEKSLAA